MKTVTFTRASAKAFSKLPAAVQVKIGAKLDRYAETGAGDVKPLTNRDGVRLRIDAYRVIFVESDTVIEVTNVGARRDIYR